MIFEKLEPKKCLFNLEYETENLRGNRKLGEMSNLTKIVILKLLI